MVKTVSHKLTTLHPFNGLFSRTTCISRHQKGKPFWILQEQEMVGWQWHQLDHIQIICTSLKTDNHASTSPLSFLQARCPSCHPTNSVKALMAPKVTEVINYDQAVVVVVVAMAVEVAVAVAAAVAVLLNVITTLPHFVVPKLNDFVFVEFCSFSQTSESGRKLCVQFKHRFIIQITLILYHSSEGSSNIISTNGRKHLKSLNLHRKLSWTLV